MKGVTNIEFVLSVFVFLATLAFISLILINDIPFYRETSLSENAKAESYQISDLLLFDKGWNKTLNENWNSNNVERIGLRNNTANSFYLLNGTKMAELETLCNRDYNKVKKLFGLNFTDIEIVITYLDDNSVIVNCKNTTSISRLKASTTRFAVNSANNRIVKIEVSVIV